MKKKDGKKGMARGGMKAKAKMARGGTASKAKKPKEVKAGASYKG